jgi:hypothetical protein
MRGAGLTSGFPGTPGAVLACREGVVPEAECGRGVNNARERTPERW